MENIADYFEDNNESSIGQPQENLQITDSMRENWKTAATWAKVLSIINLVFISFGILGVLALGSIIASVLNNSALMSEDSPLRFIKYLGGGITFYLMFLGALFAYNFFHYRFASKIKVGANYNDNAEVASAWKNLRNYYRISGIFTIFILSLYVLYFLFLLFKDITN
jgi:hypothetical protein